MVIEGVRSGDPENERRRGLTPKNQKLSVLAQYWPGFETASGQGRGDSYHEGDTVIEGVCGG